MKKLIVVGIIAAMALAICSTMVALASTSVNITITAQGSEVDISCTQSAWNVGTVHNLGIYYTVDNLTWGTFTNLGSENVDIVAHGYNMKNAGSTYTWTLHNTTPGAATFAMMGSIATVGDTQIHTSDFAFITNLPAVGGANTRTFGLEFKAPTSGTGNDLMEMVGSTGSPSETPRGLIFTASVHI